MVENAGRLRLWSQFITRKKKKKKDLDVDRMWWFIRCVFNCSGYGNIERGPSQWICFPGAWGNPFSAALGPTQDVIRLTTREVKSREIYQSQCEKSSLLEQEGDVSCTCCQRASPRCAVGGGADGRLGYLAEEELVRHLGPENRPPMSVSSHWAARLAVIMSFARNKYSTSLWQNWREPISEKHLLCPYSVQIWKEPRTY